MSVGGIAAAVGGAIALVGTLLAVVSIRLGFGTTNRGTLSTTYVDTDDGKVVAVVGLVVLLLAIATLVQPVAGIMVPAVIAGGGLAMFGFALYDRFDLDNFTSDLRDRFSQGNSPREFVHVTIGPSLYVVMVGGAIAAIGAVMASREARSVNGRS